MNSFVKGTRSSVLRSLSEAGQQFMFYVYIIQSQKDKSYYTGSTEDLKKRLQEHNRGGVRYTSSKTPYELAWYCAFRNKTRAIDFEKYLKQGSGLAFSRKRLVKVGDYTIIKTGATRSKRSAVVAIVATH